MNIATVLSQSAATFGQRPAVCLGTEPFLTYQALARRSAGIAVALAAVAPTPGARVAIYMGNRPEYFEILFGIWAAGHIAVPVNAKLHPKELAYILEDSDAALLFTDRPGDVEDFAQVVGIDGPPYGAMVEAGERFEPVRVSPESIGWLFYTSGTTGFPKGAMLSHRNLCAMVSSFLADICPVTQYCAGLHPAPLSHAAGLFSLAHFRRGAANVVPASGGFQPEEMVELINHFPGSSFFLAPTMLTRLIGSDAVRQLDVANLDLVFCGGAPLYVEDLKRALDLLGQRVWIGYGQGEAPCTISYLPADLMVDDGEGDLDARMGSVGIPRTGVAIRVVGEDGLDRPTGEPGEVIVSGDVVMAGYWNNPDATSKAVRDGWLYTGDVGALDARGFLTLKDRSKDVIISGGSNIYPREVEEVLLRYPGVAEVSVIGRPHPDWGEEVIAFVAAEETVSAEALDAFCVENIARFKRPKEYRFLSTLPKSNYGKILKTELRKLL